MPTRTVFLAALAASLTLAPSALAGSPGKWSMVGQANLDNIDEIALTRTADGVLHGVWTIPSHNSGGGGDQLVHAAISPSGVASAPNTITGGWAAMTSVPDIVTMQDGTLRVFFGGIHSTDTNDVNSNMNTATASASGLDWSLFPGTTVKGDSAYGADDGAAVLADGTPILSFGGTGAGVFVHRGLDPATPNYGIQSQFGGCCGYSPDIAVDASGQPFVAWYSNATGHLGVFAQALSAADGSPQGAPMKMPASTTPFNGKEDSSQQLMRTPIVARAGGGVFVAYGGGYPSTKQARVWRIGAPDSAVVEEAPGDHLTSLAAAPDGRIWAIWIARGGSNPRVVVSRSNKTVDEFGPPVAIGLPAGTSSGYKITGNAQAGTLDVVGLFGGLALQAQFHTQFLPGLEVVASKSKISAKKKTSVTFTVKDPDPVKGAIVTVGKKKATTNAKGKATIVIDPASKKTVTATATSPGYVKGTDKIKVRKK
jgi:hypothetical protein